MCLLKPTHTLQSCPNPCLRPEPVHLMSRYFLLREPDFLMNRPLSRSLKNCFPAMLVRLRNYCLSLLPVLNYYLILHPASPEVSDYQSVHLCLHHLVHFPYQIRPVRHLLNRLAFPVVSGYSADFPCPTHPLSCLYLNHSAYRVASGNPTSCLRSYPVVHCPAAFDPLHHSFRYLQIKQSYRRLLMKPFPLQYFQQR